MLMLVGIGIIFILVSDDANTDVCIFLKTLATAQIGRMIMMMIIIVVHLEHTIFTIHTSSALCAFGACLYVFFIF